MGLNTFFVFKHFAGSQDKKIFINESEFKRLKAQRKKSLSNATLLPDRDKMLLEEFDNDDRITKDYKEAVKQEALYIDNAPCYGGMNIRTLLSSGGVSSDYGETRQK